MRNFYILLLLSAFSSSLISCKKETVATTIDFSTYTATDQYGIILGEVDSTDWTYDAAWTQQELALVNFRITDTLTSADTLAGNVTIYPAFPNPCDGSFILSINTEHACKMKLAFVNTSMEVLHYKPAVLASGKNNFDFNFQSRTTFDKGINYRMYYAFYNYKDSMYYKGHGDFRIQ